MFGISELIFFESLRTPTKCNVFYHCHISPSFGVFIYLKSKQLLVFPISKTRELFTPYSNFLDLSTSFSTNYLKESEWAYIGHGVEMIPNV